LPDAYNLTLAEELDIVINTSLSLLFGIEYIIFSSNSCCHSNILYGLSFTAILSSDVPASSKDLDINLTQVFGIIVSYGML
jgi:hypothetical protein